MQSPRASGDISESAAAAVTACFPCGRGMVGPAIPGSEYGASPTTAFLQLRFYF